MAFLRLSACVLCFWLICAAAVEAAETTVNKIAAVVNGEMITLHELRMHTMAELSRNRIPFDDPKAQDVKRKILDTLIDDILMRQEAKRYKLSVSSSDVEKEYLEAVKRSGMPADRFEAGLKSQGVTVEMYKERIENHMLRRRIMGFMVARKVFVTPEEVNDYYEKHRDEFAGAETVDFSMIMLPENLNAPNIYQQIKSGKLNFEDAAKRHSADRSAQEGGRMTGIPWDRLPPEMQKLLGSLQDGGLSPLLRTKGGFLIFRRDGRHPARPLSLQEARPQIEEKLKAPLLDERYNEFVGQLRGKAVIDIRI